MTTPETGSNTDSATAVFVGPLPRSLPRTLELFRTQRRRVRRLSYAALCITLAASVALVALFSGGIPKAAPRALIETSNSQLTNSIVNVRTRLNVGSLGTIDINADSLHLDIPTSTDSFIGNFMASMSAKNVLIRQADSTTTSQQPDPHEGSLAHYLYNLQSLDGIEIFAGHLKLTEKTNGLLFSDNVDLQIGNTTKLNANSLQLEINPQGSGQATLTGDVALTTKDSRIQAQSMDIDLENGRIEFVGPVSILGSES